MHIIAVDDEPLALGLLVRSIREACPVAQISEFQSGHEALQFLESNRCDVAFLDIHMRGIDGLTLAKKIKELNPQCNLIFVTGYSEYICIVECSCGLTMRHLVRRNNTDCGDMLTCIL